MPTCDNTVSSFTNFKWVRAVTHIKQHLKAELFSFLFHRVMRHHHRWHALLVRLTDSGQGTGKELPHPAFLPPLTPFKLMEGAESAACPSCLLRHSQLTEQKLLWRLRAPGPPACYCIKVNYRETG